MLYNISLSRRKCNLQRNFDHLSSDDLSTLVMVVMDYLNCQRWTLIFGTLLVKSFEDKQAFFFTFPRK